METLENKADVIRSRILKRNEERISELKKKKEETAQSSNEKESVAYFTAQLQKEEHLILKLLDDSSSVEKGCLVDHFDTLTEKVLTLQKFVADSSMFLPSYDLRHSQSIVEELRSRIDEQRDKFLPKKKFAFRGNKKQVSDQTSEDVAKKSLVPSAKTENSKSTLNQISRDNVCGFSDRKGENLELSKTETAQKDIMISNLVSCQARIYGNPGVVHCKGLNNCEIKCGPVSRVVFVEDCKDCVFLLASQQLRIHTTTDSVFKIHVTSKAIIEDSSNLGFGKYDWEYPESQKDFIESGLRLDVNNWDKIDDFNWLKLDEQSPNWYLLSAKNGHKYVCR